MKRENQNIKIVILNRGHYFWAASRKVVIRDLIKWIQDLQRLPLLLINNLRGRFQIKFGMTYLYNSGAFTLIELLVVVLIIGILAAVAVPQYQVAVQKARLTSVWTVMKAIKQANQLYYLEHGEYTNDIDAWNIELPSGWKANKTKDSTLREITLPNGDNFEVVSAWISPNIPLPRIQGKTSKCTTKLLTFYASEGFKCYPGGTDLGAKVCKALGCSGGITKTTSSCNLPY